MNQGFNRSFTSHYNRLANALINDVGISLAFEESAQPAQKPRIYKALWDTGATVSVITQRIADECQLIPVGFTQVSGVGGIHNSPFYFVGIWLPNRVALPVMRVTQGNLAGNIDLLIGMDVIGLGDFAVNHKNGKTSFSFRIPSLDFVDYTAAPKPVPPTPTHARNALCHCGSGKKYKQCHGQSAA